MNPRPYIPPIMASDERPPLSELDEFRSFFQKYGIDYHETPYRPPGPRVQALREKYGGVLPDADTRVTVSQAHFLFKTGHYLGVQADEMSFFCPRR